MKTRKSKVTKGKLLSAVSALACLAIAYYAIEQPYPSVAAWVVGLPAAAIVSITAVVRGNEIPVEVDSWRSHLRRAGFFFSGIGAVNFIMTPLIWGWPSWYSLLLLWGIAAAWLTTPNMPPWWDYVTGKKKLRYKDTI